MADFLDLKYGGAARAALRRAQEHEARRAVPVLEAELAEDRADWYLIETFPGEEIKALRWLARRRFAVFLPRQQRRDHNGNAIAGWEAVFPGWIFVYCWDVGRMMPRVLNCPGVRNMVCEPQSNDPVPINQVDEDGVLFVDKLRALSWVYKDAGNGGGTATVRAERSLKRARERMTKQQRKQLGKLKAIAARRGIWDKSAWEHANALAPHERIALLRHSIDLPCR